MEVAKTPKGNGDTKRLVLAEKVVDVEVAKTPKGNGDNPGVILQRSRISAVEVAKTPKGNGDEALARSYVIAV